MDQLNQPDEFNSDAFFNDNSIQQIQQIDADANAGLDGVGTVSIPTNPGVTEQLVRRWYSGCLERIAFSRHGHIATISDDGSTIYVECLRFSQADKTWGLHDRHSLTTIFEDAVNLEFSSSGAELAVVDIKGRIWVFHISPVALNRLIQTRQGLLDPVDDLSQPIGMLWLNQDRQGRPKHVVTQTTKVDDRWVHSNAQTKPLGPYWHRGFLVAHRKGTITLFYQRGDGQYSKVVQDLSDSPDTLYSHATFAPTAEGKMLVVLHSFNAAVSVFYLAIDWTEVKQSVEGLPVITVEAVTSHVSSQSSGSALLGDVYDPNAWSLTHLKVIQALEMEQGAHHPPSILAVSASVNKSLNSTDPGFLVSSLLRRWTVAAVEQSLHPRFEDLASKGSSGTSAPRSTLQPQPDKEESVVTSINLIEGNPTITITTQDNRTDFLDCDTLASALYSATQTETASMAQSGFTFPMATPIQFPSFSPNGSIRADLSIPDGKLKLTHMTYQFPDTADDQPQSQLHAQPLEPAVDAAFAALTLSFARACWTNTSFDDLLFTASHIPPPLHTRLLSQMYATLFRPAELVHEKSQGSDLERVFHKQVVGKVLSWHSMVTASTRGLPYMGISAGDDGRAGGHRGWTLPSQWAYLTNCVRFTATLLYMSLQNVQNANAGHSDTFIDLLTGNITWGLGVIRFIVQGVLDVGDRESHPAFFVDGDGQALGDPKGDGSQGLIALLLNCHWSRLFLIAIVRAIRAYAKISDPKGRAQMQVLAAIQRETTGRGLTFGSLESLFEYRWSSPGDVDGDPKATAEKQVRMMTGGVVEPGYDRTVHVLLTKLIDVKPGLREKGLIDPLKLFTDRVRVEEVFMNGFVTGLPGEKFDIHKKKPLTQGSVEAGSSAPTVRRCVRCGSYSEDVNVPGKEWPRPIAQIMGKCVCDGNWVVEKWDGD